MQLVPRYDESVDFLRRWCPEGLWVLTAIHPSKKNAGLPTATFVAPRDTAAAKLWMEQFGAEHNLYFHVNPVRAPLSKKAERADIASLSWLHVDVDPRAGEPIEEEQTRILRLFSEDLPRGIPKPTVVVFSGGGFQGFWRLREPMRLDGDEEACERAKLYNLAIELAFKADACHNVDRIMRLPGSLNRPNERKKKKGRTVALATVAFWHEDAVYDLSTFVPAVAVQSKEDKGFSGGVSAPKVVLASENVRRLLSLDELGSGVSDFTKMVIARGSDPDNPNRWKSRSDAVWYVANELVRSGVADEVIFSILTDSGFGISAHVLDQDRPEKSALRQIARAKEFAIHPLLGELNEKHAVIEDIGGRCRVVSEVEDGILGNRTRLSAQSAADFKLRYLNRYAEIDRADGTKQRIRAGDWWLAHPQRRQFSTIVFAPEREVPGAYNLWKGFAYQPRPGSGHERFLKHVLDNICAGNQDHYRYLLGWMAVAVQHPASPGHTAIVLRGHQGTGKSFFAKTFGGLFGRHFLHVSDSKHLVGSFNAHLRDVVVLFGDEAFYAGDKKHESVLKTLVTEEMITIEAKGVDATASPNFVHLIMASNEEWVVPAGNHERRFFVLDVTTKHRQDVTYFKAIQDELSAGGYENLLHYLRAYDVSGFNVRALPQTTGLRAQKMLSYTPEKDWWFSKLRDGEALPGLGWPEYVYSHELTDDYGDHVRRYSLASRGNATRLGIFLTSCMPKGHVMKSQLWGTHDVTFRDGKTKKVLRPYVIHLPPLETCRKVWDESFGGPFEWETVREYEPPPATPKPKPAPTPVHFDRRTGTDDTPF